MHLDHRPMRREVVFNKGGAYSLVVERNLLLHREAIHVCTKVVADWLANRSAATVIRVLDLACGGMPVVMNGVMKQFVIHRFNYHGVDINADQIKTARKYKFSPNTRAAFEEGDCWQPEKLVQNPIDIVFIGLNTHHAVPEELEQLTQQLKKIMPSGGLFLNYDLFRPSQYPYLRRPNHSMDDPHLDLGWRKNFLTPLLTLMRQHRLPQNMIDETATHITKHDYPVSTPEMETILKSSGFKTQTIPLNSDSPLTPFLNVVAATA